MAKQRTVYICSNCGYESSKWAGRCNDCGEWNTLIEEIKQDAKNAPFASASASVKATPITTIAQVNTDDNERIKSGIFELDRVLGGGIVPGSTVLAGGDPGIGKSTLLLQLCDKLAKNGQSCLYVSGEESSRQIKLRSKRLGIDGEGIYILPETDMESIIASIQSLQPDIVIIDSIQTISSQKLSSTPGSVGQVRECAHWLTRLAKTLGTTIFIVGHVTKEGMIAGPKVLEHMVDTVLYFEGEKNNSFRVLRAAKNRFGSTNEIGLFDMRDNGMEEVPNPSEILIGSREKDEPGSAVMCSVEGSRPMLVEIQALVSPTPFGNPRRTSTGLDYNRMLLLIAVMEKKLGFGFYNQDAYINVAGGLKLNEPASDLCTIAALASVFKGLAVPTNTAIMGEVGLTGEVRAVGNMDKRLGECAKMGFTKCIVPKGSLKGARKPDGLTVLGVENVRKMLELVF